MEGSISDLIQEKLAEGMAVLQAVAADSALQAALGEAARENRVRIEVRAQADGCRQRRQRGGCAASGGGVCRAAFAKTGRRCARLR